MMKIKTQLANLKLLVASELNNGKIKNHSSVEVDEGL
jgi:hypothetical protein